MNIVAEIQALLSTEELVKKITLGQVVYIELVAEGEKDTPIFSGVTSVRLLDGEPSNYHPSRLFIWPTEADDSPSLEGVGKSGLSAIGGGR